MVGTEVRGIFPPTHLPENTKAPLAHHRARGASSEATTAADQFRAVSTGAAEGATSSTRTCTDAASTRVGMSITFTMVMW